MSRKGGAMLYFQYGSAEIDYLKQKDKKLAQSEGFLGLRDFQAL